MFGIVTLLKAPFESKVKTIWKEIEKKFQFKTVQQTPFPHLTLYAAAKYNHKTVGNFLSSFAKPLKPVKIKTIGVDYFDGDNFVAFNKVRLTRELSNFHQKLCRGLVHIVSDPLSYYLPNEWTPHITFLKEERNRVTEKRKVVDYLNSLQLEWEFPLDNLTVIEQNSLGVTVIKDRFEIPKE